MAVKRGFLLVLLVFTAIGVGCKPNIVGGDAGVYSNFRLYAVASNDMGSVYEAGVKSLEQLDVDIESKAKDVFSAKIVGEAADGKDITIVIKPKDDNSSELSIKVGTFGNKYRSQVIYDKIRENLGS